jgi:hypothetical protein
MNQEYIFLAGAPGSRWSSIAKHLYSSPQINTSDSDSSYTKPNEEVPMHVGTYWDPGMEYGNKFDVIDTLSKEYIEDQFNSPFIKNDKTKIIKSHQFSKHLEFIKNKWDMCPIIIAYRPDQICYEWWLEAGGMDITYPSYLWYSNNMTDEIKIQNFHINEFIKNNKCVLVKDTTELAFILDIKILEFKDFLKADTSVYVYIPKGKKI